MVPHLDSVKHPEATPLFGFSSARTRPKEPRTVEKLRRTGAHRTLPVFVVALSALLASVAPSSPASAATFDVALTAGNTSHDVSTYDLEVNVPLAAGTIRLVEPPSMAGDTYEQLTYRLDNNTTGFSYEGTIARSGGVLTLAIPGSAWSGTVVGDRFEVDASGYAGEEDGRDSFTIRGSALVVAAGAATVTKTIDQASVEESWLSYATVDGVKRGDTVSVAGTAGWFSTSPSQTTEFTPVFGYFPSGGAASEVSITADGSTASFVAPAPSRRTAAEMRTDDPVFGLAADDDARLKSVTVFLYLEYADTSPHIERISGSDRYSAASAISRAAYPSGAPVVFIASGTKFPDALSAAPVAALMGGPLLITLPDRLPESTRTELERLDPSDIVVVGGVNSVSDVVFDELSAIVPDTIRISGADRYAVARNLVQFAWGETGTEAAYIATGVDFPDALAASAAAGSRGIPVVLVYGKSNTVDSATMNLLDDLGVTEPIIAGGPASVSPGIETYLESLNDFGYVERLDGENRYTASLAIARSAFNIADQVFFATGANFPDALAGAAWAGAVSGPLYTLPGNCVLDGILKDIDRYHLSDITLLGGPQSLTPAVESLSPCGWGDWVEIGGEG
jgi:putative cell wall-binding protein